MIFFVFFAKYEGVIIIWSNLYCYIPILLLDEEDFKHKIKFLASFWNFGFYNNFFSRKWPYGTQNIKKKYIYITNLFLMLIHNFEELGIKIQGGSVFLVRPNIYICIYSGDFFGPYLFKSRRRTHSSKILVKK